MEIIILSEVELSTICKWEAFGRWTIFVNKFNNKHSEIITFNYRKWKLQAYEWNCLFSPGVVQHRSLDTDSFNLQLLPQVWAQLNVKQREHYLVT